MNGPSTSDHEFLEAVRDLFAAPEVLVVVRYVYGAGSKDFLILRNMEEFTKLISSLRERDSVIVMKSFDKIMEGTVDPALIEAALSAYPTGRCWILIGEDHLQYTSPWAYAESRDELRDALQDRLGNHVCVIEEPDYISEEPSIAAYLPDEDGQVRPGAY